MPHITDEQMDFERLVPDRASPGQMLKMAREMRHLSPNDIAKQLNLRVKWILDIENDHYNDAVALIYVKGHLQSYARLVGLSADEVLSVFKAMKFDEAFLKRKHQESKPEPLRHKQQAVFSYQGAKAKVKPWKWYGVLALTVLVLCGIGTWFGLRDNHASRGTSINVSSQSSSQLQIGSQAMTQLMGKTPDLEPQQDQ